MKKSEIKDKISKNLKWWLTMDSGADFWQIFIQNEKPVPVRHVCRDRVSYDYHGGDIQETDRIVDYIWGDEFRELVSPCHCVEIEPFKVLLLG